MSRLQHKNSFVMPAIVALAIVMAPAAASAQALGDMSDEELLAWIHAANEQAAAQGLDMQIYSIEFFTRGQGRPVTRVHQEDARWVPSDSRRLAQGDDLTYIIEENNNPGPTGFGSFPTATIRRAFNTWNEDTCLSGLDLVERPSVAGVDTTVSDDFFGFCPQADLPGSPLPIIFHADIIQGGWYPEECFSPFNLALTIQFTSTGDANGDNYFDFIHVETFYNDRWDWGIDLPIESGIDIETVALHEIGHDLLTLHFGPPPVAVMNIRYDGILQELRPIDHAGVCTLYASWPNQ